MSKTQTKCVNQLMHFRKRMRFSQRYVAKLMGLRGPSAISEYETGTNVPTLFNALRLGAIYRAPVEFLFREKYLALQGEIRKQEARVPKDRQGVLPIVFP